MKLVFIESKVLKSSASAMVQSGANFASCKVSVLISATLPSQDCEKAASSDLAGTADSRDSVKNLAYTLVHSTREVDVRRGVAMLESKHSSLRPLLCCVLCVILCFLFVVC